MALSKITSASINDGTITSSDLANSTITGSKIASSTVTGTNISTSTLPNLGKRNLIINGDMKVNQRNVTSGVTSGYFIDRFRLSGCSASAVLTSNTPTEFPTAVSISATSGNPIISQRVESNNVKHVSGKVLTASFFAKNISNATILYVSLAYPGSADSWGSSTTISEQNLGNLTTDWVKYTASWTVPAGGLNGLGLNILCAGTSTFTMGVAGVQLEVGSTATAFEHRTFAEELSACQRYYVRAGGANYANIFGTGGIANTTGSWFGFGNIPVPMRAYFTTTVTGTPRIQNGQAGYNASGVGFSPIAADNQPSTVISGGCNASGLTLYRWHNMDANNGAALVQLDAEL